MMNGPWWLSRHSTLKATQVQNYPSLLYHSMIFWGGPMDISFIFAMFLGYLDFWFTEHPDKDFQIQFWKVTDRSPTNGSHQAKIKECLSKPRLVFPLVFGKFFKVQDLWVSFLLFQLESSVINELASEDANCAICQPHSLTGRELLP